MNKVRLAIFGANQGARIGHRAVLNPACEFVALAGFGQQAEDAAKEFDVPLYADYTDLLAQVDVDAVAIALPNQLHLPATKACVDAGVKYILLEKPIASTPEDGQAIIDICNEAGATLLIGHHRLRPASRAQELPHVAPSSSAFFRRCSKCQCLYR